MTLNCPDPNFPIEVQLQVLTDGGFGASGTDGSPNWELVNWINSNGTLIGNGINFGIFILQRAAKLQLSYGSGENEINVGDKYLFRFHVKDASFEFNTTHEYGHMFPVWGGIAGEIQECSNGIHQQILTAPATGDFAFQVKRVFGERFWGKITFLSLYTLNCVASSEVDTGGSGGDIGSGDGDVSGGVGGVILQAGETPNTGFSSKFYGEDKEEILRTDMRIFDNEIDDDFGRDSLGGQ